MLASMRAELLVLRKWPAAWGLMLVTPVLVLLSSYVAQFIFYLALTPAEYGTDGTPAQNLQSLLPSQFNIIAVSQFSIYGTVPFIVLGAAMAGGDWGRGTITTALLQRPGRARTFAGQALALAVAVAASVLATFAVAAAASTVIRLVESRSVNPYLGAMPGTVVIAEGVGVALLIALAYGTLGLFLGAACRSAGRRGRGRPAVDDDHREHPLRPGLAASARAPADDQRPHARRLRGHLDRAVRDAGRRRGLAELPAGPHSRRRVDPAGLPCGLPCADPVRAAAPGRRHRKRCGPWSWSCPRTC
jgi:hypothetical protein